MLRAFPARRDKHQLSAVSSFHCMSVCQANRLNQLTSQACAQMWANVCHYEGLHCQVQDGREMTTGISRVAVAIVGWNDGPAGSATNGEL